MGGLASEVAPRDRMRRRPHDVGAELRKRASNPRRTQHRLAQNGDRSFSVLPVPLSSRSGKSANARADRMSNSIT